MDKLRTYLNSLTSDEQTAFAINAETSIGYLRKAISGGQLLKPATCVKIELNSNAEVTRKDLRPDDWKEIWPELDITNPKRRHDDLYPVTRKRRATN
jgi:DNA-binding transcriptional regulator YdaS (Cro superfamily)